MNIQRKGALRSSTAKGKDHSTQSGSLLPLLATWPWAFNGALPTLIEKWKLEITLALPGRRGWVGFSLLLLSSALLCTALTFDLGLIDQNCSISQAAQREAQIQNPAPNCMHVIAEIKFCDLKFSDVNSKALHLFIIST